MKQPKKRPRGRPPVENPRTERINWRVTPERKARYERAAKKAGKGLTPWLDDVADDAS
jgi:uncharacterized protein (DUF1778 family)